MQSVDKIDNLPQNMDLIRLKIALARRGQASEPRFHYDPLADLSEPHITGMVPSERDFDLGTPNFTRSENITLVASSTSRKCSLWLDLKWRPFTDNKSAHIAVASKRLVTLVSRFVLELDEKIYLYDHAETYEPSVSSVRENRILQYGSNGANLKLCIACPYRRARLTFRGYMQLLKENANEEGSKPELAHVKFSAVIGGTSQIYDFNRDINLDCFRQQCMIRTSRDRSLEQLLNELYFHDRHDEQVRLVGECVLNKDTASKRTVYAWGFYARHFIEVTKKQADGEKQMETRRLFAYFNNGQTFQLGNTKIGDDQVDFGYTSFKFGAATAPIERPPVIEWDSLSADTNEFEFKVSGQSKTLECKAKKRAELSPFYDLEMNRKQGWALVLTEFVFDTPEELEAIKRNREELIKAIEDNQVACSYPRTEKDKPSIVSIADPVCTSADLVGAKASSLAHLRAFSEIIPNQPFAVPGALVLTRYAHDAFLNDNPTIMDQIDALEKLMGEGRLEELKKMCEQLQILVTEAELSAELIEELSARLETEFGTKYEEIPFAVRSSSWGEDEEDMSAAGQLSTVLGVRGINSICSAILACLASKFSYPNVEYKRLHGLRPSLPMAIVVQSMVECDKAGVMFTCDPTNGDPQFLTITANYGLGESVVSGESEPDCIRINTTDLDDLKVAEIVVGQKKVIVDAGSLQGQENNQSNYDRTKCCLSEEESLRLAGCGLGLLSFYQSHRDIEWGYKGSELYLLQARPVTGLDVYLDIELLHEADLASRAENEFTTRANIGEVMPFASKPLTLTYAILMWRILGHRLGSKFTFRPLKYEPQSLTYNDLMVDCYYTFFIARCSGLFQLSGNAQEKPLMARAMEVSFFGHEVGPQPELSEAIEGIDLLEDFFTGPKYELYTLGLKLAPNAVIMREKSTMRNLRAAIRSMKHATGYNLPGANKLLALLTQMANIIKFKESCWFNHILLIMLASNSNMGLINILSKYITEPVQLFSAFNKFLAQSPGVISAEIPKRIASMAQIIQAKGQDELDKFLAMSGADAVAYVEGGSEDQTLANEFSTFIERFGHRCYNEFEIADKSWREDKEAIIETIKRNCKAGKIDANKKLASIHEIIDSLKLPNLSLLDLFKLKHVIVPKCQTMVAARELTKDILVEYFDNLRDATRQLAKEMRLQLRIPDEDLLYYFYYDELEPLARQPQPSLVTQALRRRQMFKRLLNEPWKFDEVIHGHELIPNHLKPSKELDEAVANAPKLFGTPASSGRVQARVCLVQTHAHLDKVRAGQILVTHSTDIAFSPIFPLLVGIVTEVGGLISHGAVVAREYGLPSVLGVQDVTRILEDGEEILLDADNGTITRLSK